MCAVAQVTKMTPAAAAAVSVKMVRASTAMCQILATAGPILAETNAAAAMTATAAMPAPSFEGLQHDGLHMTGRLVVDSVRHATPLFLNGLGQVGVAGRAGGWPSPRPGTHAGVRTRAPPTTDRHRSPGLAGRSALRRRCRA